MAGKGIESNSDWNFKDLEEMLGNAKTLKRNDTGVFTFTKQSRRLGLRIDTVPLPGTSLQFRDPTSTSAESMREDFCHHLLGIKIGLRDSPSGSAVALIVSIYGLKSIGCFLKRQEAKHPLSVREE